jgi:hypothetical protein
MTPLTRSVREHCWVFEGYFCRRACPYKHRFGLLAKADPSLKCELADPTAPPWPGRITELQASPSSERCTVSEHEEIGVAARSLLAAWDGGRSDQEMDDAADTLRAALERIR